MSLFESNYSEPESRYRDDERCEQTTKRGERCKRAWMQRTESGEWLCWPHYDAARLAVPSDAPEKRRHDPSDHDCKGGVRGDRFPL